VVGSQARILYAGEAVWKSSALIRLLPKEILELLF
jgi:hypothetical protein